MCYANEASSASAFLCNTQSSLSFISQKIHYSLHFCPPATAAKRDASHKCKQRLYQERLMVLHLSQHSTLILSSLSQIQFIVRMCAKAASHFALLQNWYMGISPNPPVNRMCPFCCSRMSHSSLSSASSMFSLSKLSTSTTPWRDEMCVAMSKKECTMLSAVGQSESIIRRSYSDKLLYSSSALPAWNAWRNRRDVIRGACHERHIWYRYEDSIDQVLDQVSSSSLLISSAENRGSWRVASKALRLVSPSVS